MQNAKIACPNCASKNTRKHTQRKNKQQTVQIYYCKDCNKYFSDNTKRLSNKTYSTKVILNAISLYNLGHTQQQTSKLISQKFKIRIPQRTISEWINQYKEICTYSKLRKKAIKLYKPNNIIFSKPLYHTQLYNFQYHKAKLEILFKDVRYNNQFHNTSQFYEPLKNYLEKIPTKQFPHHIFKSYKEGNNKSIINNNAISVRDNLTETHADLTAKRCPAAEIDKNTNLMDNAKINMDSISKQQRASQIKFSHLKIIHIKKQNQATRLAKLSLNLANSNKERHQAIQNFMLINDSTTIAVEVPVYLTNWDAGYYRNQKGFIFPLNNYKTPITGHIDILQIRNGLIHILDYKPDADKQQPIEQLTLYAMALSRKLNLPLYFFKAAWFDENNYYEFFPLHAVYKKQKI